MKTLILPVGAVIALGLVGFFGSPFLVRMSSSYLGIQLVVMSSTDSELPRNSLAALLTTCSISAALLFWLYVKWYRKSSIWIYFGVLAAALALALAGIALNLFQLQSIFKEHALPSLTMLGMGGMDYFAWGAWPVIVVTVIALVAMFLLQPGDPDEEDDHATENSALDENIGTS
jgi:hypothetical protein